MNAVDSDNIKETELEKLSVRSNWDDFNFAEFIEHIHKWSEDQGFWKHDPERNTIVFYPMAPGGATREFYEAMCTTFKMAKMALIVSESAEAIEDIRRGKTHEDNFKFELADIILRVLNFASHYNIDIIEALVEKQEINDKRTILKEDGKQI